MGEKYVLLHLGSFSPTGSTLGSIISATLNIDWSPFFNFLNIRFPTSYLFPLPNNLSLVRALRSHMLHTGG